MCIRLRINSSINKSLTFDLSFIRGFREGCHAPSIRSRILHCMLSGIMRPNWVQSTFFLFMFVNKPIREINRIKLKSETVRHRSIQSKIFVETSP